MNKGFISQGGVNCNNCNYDKTKLTSVENNINKPYITRKKAITKDA